jgi:hypothetical protein
MKNYKKNTTGALYLALGIPHLCMAMLSIKTLRKFNKNMPVCILTNIERPLWFSKNDINMWKYIEVESKDSRIVKTSLYDYTPFDKTIFIDTDTIILGDLSFASYYLDYFDICIKQKNVPYPDSKKARYKLMSGNFTVKELPHWNSGVILFAKNNKVEDFFKDWHCRFNKLNYAFDQISLVESILYSNCKIMSLEDRWNFQDVSILTKKQKNSTLIVHYSSSLTPYIRREIRLNFIKLTTDKRDLNEIDKYFKLKDAHRLKKDGLKRYLIKRIKWRFYDLKSLVSFNLWK